MSYRRRDAGDFAKQIYEHLKVKHDIFIDVDIQLGEIWSSSIETNISICDIFIPIVTHGALISKEVEKEVLQAQRENKIIIPCIHSDISYDEIKWDLSKFQVIEFDDKYDLARNLYSRIVKIQNKNRKVIGNIVDLPRNVLYETKADFKIQDSTKSNDKYLPVNKNNFPKILFGKNFKGIDFKIPIPIMIVVVAIGSVFAFSNVFIPTPQYYDKALDVDPNDKNALNAEGNELYDIGNYDGAIQYYDKALSLDPNFTKSLYNKGFALYKMDDYDGAIQYYDKALAVAPNYTNALHAKGMVLDDLENYDGAIQYYDKALSINPYDDDVLDSKGTTLRHMGNYTGAIQYFDKALAIHTNDKNVLVNKGIALEKMGNYTGAIQYYDKALSLDPTYTRALNAKKNLL